MQTTQIDQSCPRCQQMLLCHMKLRQQVYSVEGELGKYVFDVEKARNIVRAGKCRVGLVEPELLMRMLEVNEEHVPEHIDHVDPTVPGIIAQRYGGYCLMDGNHRARRCLRDGLPFYVYALSLQESVDCMIKQEPVSFTAEMMAREFRGMLNNNPECALLSATIDLTFEENEAETVATIRACLTAEENARLELNVQRQTVGAGDWSPA